MLSDVAPLVYSIKPSEIKWIATVIHANQIIPKYSSTHAYRFLEFIEIDDIVESASIVVYGGLESVSP